MTIIDSETSLARVTTALMAEMDPSAALAFAHGANAVQAVFVESGDGSDTLPDLVTKAIERKTGNPVTDAFQHTDEFALGAMLSAYAIKTMKNEPTQSSEVSDV